jgi:hypothetical protein
MPEEVHEIVVRRVALSTRGKRQSVRSGLERGGLVSSEEERIAKTLYCIRVVVHDVLH